MYVTSDLSYDYIQGAGEIRGRKILLMTMNKIT